MNASQTSSLERARSNLFVPARLAASSASQGSAMAPSTQAQEYLETDS
jgi:hypothetical protein